MNVLHVRINNSIHYTYWLEFIWLCMISYIINDFVLAESLDDLINAIVEADNRGVTLAPMADGSNGNNVSVPSWSFGQSFFFASTVVTTIGNALWFTVNAVLVVFVLLYTPIYIHITTMYYIIVRLRASIPTFNFRKSFLYGLCLDWYSYDNGVINGGCWAITYSSDRTPEMDEHKSWTFTYSFFHSRLTSYPRKFSCFHNMNISHRLRFHTSY